VRDKVPELYPREKKSAAKKKIHNSERPEIAGKDNMIGKGGGQRGGKRQNFQASDPED